MPFVEPRPARPLAIRITPLIDVVFILLVFFMLTSRLLPVDLMEVNTRVSTPTNASKADPIPEITLRAQQRLAWNGQTFSLDALVTRLKMQGIRRVKMTSAPEARVQDFTLALSTLDAHGIEPNWVREPQGSALP